MFKDKLSPTLVNLLCVLVIVLSLGGLGSYALPTIHAARNLDPLKAEKDSQAKQELPSDQSDSFTENGTGPLIDFEALKAVNPDTVGWLTIEGTDIDLPVVQTDNNEKYLSTTFEGEVVPLWGCVFLDCAYDAQRIPKAQNNVLYGHSNIGRPSLFGTLLQYKDEDFYREHQSILYSRPGDQGALWQIISVFNAESDQDYRRPDFYSTTDYLTYFKNIQALSLYPNDEKILPNGEMLTLSTCDFNVEGFNDPRLVIVAQRVP